MGTFFKPSMPDQPKIDEGKIRAKELRRRRMASGEASTNIVNKPTLGGTQNGTK